MTVRGRVLLFGLAITLLFSAVGAAGFVLIFRSAVPELREAVSRKTVSTAVGLASAAVVPLAEEDTARLHELLAGLAGDGELVRASVQDPDGRVLAVIGDGPPVPADLASHSLHTSAGAYSYRVPVEVEGLALGLVSVSFRPRKAERLYQISIVLTSLSLAAGVASVLFAALFARSLARPLHQMMRFSETVARGDFSHRLALRGARELEQLADHLDRMTRAIASRDQALESKRRELQGSVDTLRRTQEELMQSTRLASVGEMAGRTAHEVLNPVTSIHGRLSRIATADREQYVEYLDTLEAIVAGWNEAYRDGGVEGLMASLVEPTGDGLLVDEDLGNLAALAAALREAHEHGARDIDFLRREINRIVHIIDGMRSLTRRRSVAELQPLRPILDEAADILADGLRKRSIAADIVCAAEVMVRVDRYELIQVLTNLLRNSMMAIEESRGRRGGVVRLVAKRTDGRVHVRIADDGAGIAPEHVPYLFEPSFTTRSSTDGTGLGLSISRRLVRGRGGELSLETTVPGHGTIFLVDLPVGTDNVTGAHEVIDERSTMAATPAVRGSHARP